MMGTQPWGEKADVTPTPAKPVLKQEENQLSFGRAALSRVQLTGTSYQECRVNMNIIS